MEIINYPRYSRTYRPMRIKRMFRLAFTLSALFVVALAVAGQSCRSPKENAQKPTLTNVTAPGTAKTEAEKKAEERQKNLETRPAAQTGTHL